MKAIVNIVRVLVGVLFIFSGLIKADDPLGLSYKMKEFFEVWSDGLAHGSFFLNQFLINFFHFFHEHSLTLAVIMIAFEIIAGAALLLGWQMKFFSWFLLLLILFFTFLTGYAFLSRNPDGSLKFTNCGCFGDCIPLTVKTSFLKDIILTTLIGFLFWQRKNIQPLFSKEVSTLSMPVVIFLSFGIQWYMLTYLPVIDCLPFKKGKNIAAQMKMPADAIPDSTVITFVYEKQGKKVEFTSENFPADFNDSVYKFVNRYDKVIRKGKNNEPPIKGFSLSGNSDADSTGIVLSQPYAVLMFCMDFSNPVSRWKDDFSKLYAEAKNKNIPVYIVTTRIEDAPGALAGTSFADAPVFKCDFTAIRTAARVNPTIYLLKEGTIVDKQSYKRMSKITSQVSSLPVQHTPMNQDMLPRQDSSN
ncbi:MAG TPA: BT_3928 family protein [Chitinophagaceae bacterium]|nr:BT_3928 family protein [Chitinophagaceae bacterium]